MNPTVIPGPAEMAIIFPLVAQVALTTAISIAMGVARQTSMKERRQHPNDMALAGPEDWTPAAQKAANSYKSQFELPVLFYVAVLTAYVTRTADGLILWLAWIFVVSRVVHAIIHIGPNQVTWRGPAFLVGVIAVVAMWAVLANRLFATGS